MGEELRGRDPAHAVEDGYCHRHRRDLDDGRQRERERDRSRSSGYREGKGAARRSHDDGGHRHRADKRRRSKSPERSRDRDRDREYRSRRSVEDEAAVQHDSHSHHHHRGAWRQGRSSAHSHASLHAPGELPYGSRRLSRRSDFVKFRPLLARYLDVQKNLRVRDMDERELRGRWKSFVSKWNEGVLAEGWYDPEMFVKAAEEYDEEGEDDVQMMEGKSGGNQDGDGADVVLEGSDDDDDDYGPRLPGRDAKETRGTTRKGPGIPSFQDLELKRETAEEDRLERAAQLRLERKADRAEQKARLEELVPRAEAGTRERQLEKRREVNEKMKQFRERSPGAAAEVNDSELMGGGDSLADYRRIKAESERKKSERELRREEMERARMEEREERLREFREREESTIAHLKELARQRFG